MRDSKEFGQVYINSDQAVAERFKSKQLREECKSNNDSSTEKDAYYYGIRNDQVVKLIK